MAEPLKGDWTEERKPQGQVPGSPPRGRRPDRRGPLTSAMHWARKILIWLKHTYYRRLWGMDLHPGCRFSLSVKFDRTNPKGVHVADGSYIAFGAVILAHDLSRHFHADTYIGRNCFIGANAIIMPGVRVGDECIIGAGSVVIRDVPSNSICAGNPAKIVKSGIRTLPMGILEDAYQSAINLYG